jgi:4-hydroxy-tetrahydrodipicolinate synthase
MDALFLESNPIPLKAALAWLGICGAAVRLPLTFANEATQRGIAEVMATFRGDGCAEAAHGS